MFVPSLTIKKFVEFVSVSFKSKGFPVGSEAPALVILTVVDPAATPRPICFGLTPPFPVAPPPEEAVAVV